MDLASKSILSSSAHLVYKLEDRHVYIDGPRVIKITSVKEYVTNEEIVLKHLAALNYPYAPKFLSSGEVGGFYFISKTYIEGETLEKEFANLDEEVLLDILQQIRSQLNFIHDLPHPEGVDKLSPAEYYLEKICTNKKMEVAREIVVEMSLRTRSVFCHGDFHPRNIIVKNGKLAGFIDWEFAGIRPISSDGYFERFWQTPCLEAFSNVYSSMGYHHQVVTLDHIVFCMLTDNEEKALRIINRLLNSSLRSVSF